MISENCEAGTYRNIDTYLCENCPVNTISTEKNEEECSSCGEGTSSNEEKTECGQLVQD